MTSSNITPPVPSDNDRGTLPAEQLQTIVQRALKSAAENTETIAGAALKHAEREAADGKALDEWLCQQRQSRAIKADARAQRAAGNVAFARGATVVGGTTLTGFMIAGPVGALFGCGVGWVLDRFLGGGRP